MVLRLCLRQFSSVHDNKQHHNECVLLRQQRVSVACTDCVWVGLHRSHLLLPPSLSPTTTTTKTTQKVHGYSRVVMVGDGATDLEARTPDAANIFIG